MISSKDRSGYFGASDTDKIIGNWNTETFEKWWLTKLSINNRSFSNKYTEAGTYFEHPILLSLGIPMELDRQFIVDDYLLRVNLDGDDGETIYECKTFQYSKGFKLPQKYINQVQVQMFATGMRKAKIVAYGLTESDYNNFFNPIQSERLFVFDIDYNEKWINETYLPKLAYLSDCLKEGRFP